MKKSCVGEYGWLKRLHKAKICLIIAFICAISTPLVFVNSWFALLLVPAFLFAMLGTFLADDYTYDDPGSGNTGETTSS